MNASRAAVLLSFLLACAALVPSGAAASRVELIYDGDLVQKADLESFGGGESLSVKSAAALFRGKTQWYPIAGKVVLQLNNQKVTFTANSRTALIGNRKVSMSGRAHLVKGSLFIPVDFFAAPEFEEVADCKITWDRDAQVLSAEPKVTLYSPRIYSRARATKIVIESKEPFDPEVRKKDRSIWADLPKAQISAEETLKVNDGVVKTVSLSKERRGVSIRVALTDAATSYAWKVEENPPRLVIVINNPKPGSSAESDDEEDDPSEALRAASASPPAPVLKESAPRAEKPVRAAGPGRIRKIVVDAGHGGKDAGAVGRQGTKEKDINLLIALELARILRVEGEYEVLLTRSDDTFVPLVDRSLFANQNKADLFISIHCNASVSKSQSGFEVYYLAENASDPHAEATEALENSVVALEGPKSAQKQRVQELLFSMAQNEFINESSLLCNAVAKSVRRRAGVPDRGVKQANFHVLHGAQMPAILIETAFITHPPEESKLRQRKFRSAVVDAVLSAVQDYEKKLQVLYGKKD